MKSIQPPRNRKPTVSLPVRGAWIEMQEIGEIKEKFKSLPVRGAWIEIKMAVRNGNENGSLPVRGAWIEIV